MTARYAGMPFWFLDATIDPVGVVLSARDTAERAITYAYDAEGRVTAVNPPGAASTSYVYKPARVTSGGSLEAPASVAELTVAASGSIKREYQYDSFGRLWREKSAVPADTGTGEIWTARETLFDGAGRKASVSEVVSLGASEFTPLLPKTTFVYDSFGRPTKTTAPDQTETWFGYFGARKKIRTVPSAGGITPLAVETTELYDSFGRLIEVQENSGTNGELVSTKYTYDIGNRLSGVVMPSATDIATTMSFSTVAPGVRISFVQFDEILKAVNAIRAAAGWSGVSWATILSPNDPLPAPSAGVMARHVTALRARMNEALHGLGVPVAGYLDSDPHLVDLKAQHLIDLQSRAQ